MVRIGDEVYVHGYIDEIRKDIIIIRNDGGYFGTVESEIVSGELRTKQDVEDAYSKSKDDVLKVLESLKSEYNAYRHIDNDYWRGVRYALDVLGGEG